jgi:hypothetical protein
VGDTAAWATQHRLATKLRQSAEWGMRAFQGSFPHVKDQFIFSHDPRDRQLVFAFDSIAFLFLNKLCWDEPTSVNFLP